MAQTEEKFSGLNDLYQRLQPALSTKVTELRREKINGISEKDIWNYCVVNIWNMKKDLRIYEMVDDILNTDILNLEIFKRKINKN